MAPNNRARSIVRRKEDTLNSGATYDDLSSAKFQEPSSAAGRYRKKQEEMDVLYKEFKKNKGKMPPRKQRVLLAAELGLKEN